MGLKSFVDKTKLGITDATSKLAETATQLVDTSKEKIQELSIQILTEIDGLKPILRQCGFIIKDLNITFPLPAEFKMTIEQTGKGTKTLEEILYEDEKLEHKLSTLQKGVLNSMLRANGLAELTKRYGYTFKQYDVVLTTPPKVTIHLIANKPPESAL